MALVAVALAPGSAATARGDEASAGIRVIDVEASDDGAVGVTVSVPDLRAAGINPATAFEVREDGEPRDVDTVAVESRDLEVAVVVDISSEQPRQQLRELQNIAMEMALRLPRETPMVLVSAGAPPRVVQPATTDVLERAAAAGHLEPGGEGAVQDALVLAMGELSTRPDARRSVVVLGASEGLASSAARDDVLEQLEVADAALSVVLPAADATGSQALDDLATATGGRVVPLDDHPEPFEAAGVVLDDLLHQYRLTFERRSRAAATVGIRLDTETLTAETTVDLPAPAETRTDESRSGTAEAGDPSSDEDGEDRGALAARPGATPQTAQGEGWLLVIAALGAVILFTVGAALSVARLPAARAGSTVRAFVDHPIRRSGSTGRAAPTSPDAPAPEVATGPSRRPVVRRQRAPRASAGPSPAALPRATVGLLSLAPGALRRGAALAASGAAAVARTATRPLRGITTAGSAVHRGLSARGRTPSRPSPPRWSDVAAQVHREVGGDGALLDEAAERIEAERERTAADLRAVGFEGRLAAIMLVPVPLAVGMLRYLMDPVYVERITAGALGWLSLAAAAALTVAGALWLRRVAKPPFAPRPARWRAHQEWADHEERVADALDRAWLYALADLDLEPALRRALPDDEHLAQVLEGALRPAQGTDPASGDDVDAPEQAPGWVGMALHRPEGESTADVLAAIRARMHAERVGEAEAQALRLPVATTVPFLVCILPATLLVGLMAW